MIPGLDRIIPAIATAATFMGMGAVVVSQGILDDSAVTWERLVGGGILFVAATLIVRWTFKLLAEVRNGANEDRAAWINDRQALIEQLSAFRELLHDEREAWTQERADILEQLTLARELITTLTAQLETERQLRISLEAKGVVDRRNPGE